MQDNKSPLDQIKDVSNTIDIDEILTSLRWMGNTVSQAGIQYKSSEDKDHILGQLESLIEAMYYISTINRIVDIDGAKT